jgi:hypothetical protein
MVENPSSSQGPLRAIASLTNSKTKGSCGVVTNVQEGSSSLLGGEQDLAAGGSQFRVDHSHGVLLYWLIRKELGAGCQ